MIRLLRLFSQMILMFSTDAKIKWADRIRYIFDSFFHVIPVAILFKMADVWFEDNKQFVAAIFWLLTLNMIVGIFRHLKFKTFNWADFFGKNAIIVFSVVVIYFSLEMLLIILDGFPAIDYFEMVLQAMTLTYPISKICKNVYIISNEKYPPKWLMKKIYNFEKTGDLEKLLKNEED